MKSKVKLFGNKKDGWVISIEDEHGFAGDIPLTHDELLKLKKILDKKIK